MNPSIRKLDITTPNNFPAIDNGLYRIFYRGDPGEALAAVGNDNQGRKWFLPTSWPSATPSFDWTLVLAVQLIQPERPAVSQAMQAEAPKPRPLPMLLFCPLCHVRHIDEGEHATRPHKTHACQACGNHFTPALVPTVGVQFLPGCKNAE